MSTRVLLSVYVWEKLCCKLYKHNWSDEEIDNIKSVFSKCWWDRTLLKNIKELKNYQLTVWLHKDAAYHYKIFVESMNHPMDNEKNVIIKDFDNVVLYNKLTHDKCKRIYS